MNEQKKTVEPSQGEPSFGGSHWRMEYEEMEHPHRETVHLLEKIMVGVGFGAVTILVTMVLVAVGTSLI